MNHKIVVVFKIIYGSKRIMFVINVMTNVLFTHKLIISRCNMLTNSRHSADLIIYYQNMLVCVLLHIKNVKIKSEF